MDAEDRVPPLVWVADEGKKRIREEEGLTGRSEGESREGLRPVGVLVVGPGSSVFPAVVRVGYLLFYCRPEGSYS